jgi:Asp-tRNA(Asn)/Glu-tRNA(Gln) amidotransferase A subunit family amidase
MSDPALLTATAALARIRAGTLSPAALTEACLARIDAREPALHAFAFIDRAQAPRRARCMACRSA